MKFLVIRLSSIGDIVLASPVLRCLKTQLVTAEVHFLSKKKFRAVTEANPYIDKFFYYDEDLDETVDDNDADAKDSKADKDDGDDEDDSVDQEVERIERRREYWRQRLDKDW